MPNPDDHRPYKRTRQTIHLRAPRCRPVGNARKGLPFGDPGRKENNRSRGGRPFRPEYEVSADVMAYVAAQLRQGRARGDKTEGE
jgi:hypothetical protein